jgi:hypothetical protein
VRISITYSPEEVYEILRAFKTRMPKLVNVKTGEILSWVEEEEVLPERPSPEM